ncbi:TetR/AcrR family transcriptional regulator [Hydrocarboniphaga sp.]|uniref:TetR/AcrR family transcriptional regulator n=1 Tax=Hydrocarboniphaga sp. TaxID=2033016 RepID=UPI003D09E8FC
MNNSSPRPPEASAETVAARKSLANATPDEAEREPRGARRKRETREKLLEAAFRLMAERGMDAVAINEITEAADVGFGSFYNHFESKEAIYAVVMDSVFEEFGDALDLLVKNVDDPAEFIAICVRHTILRARREPLWGRFLVREGFSARVLSRGLGVRLMRDILIGVSKGRFNIPDPFMTFVTIGGGVLGAIAAELELAGKPTDSLKQLKQLGLSSEDIPERAAAVALHNLGLSFDESRRIALLSLPAVDRPFASS